MTSENFSKRNRSQTNLVRKTDEDLIGELFDQFDIDKDGYLDEKEIEAFLLYIGRKRGKSLKKIDENVIGSFLTNAGVMEEPRISKKDFVSHFRNI